MVNPTTAAVNRPNRIDVHAHYTGGAVAELFRGGFSPANGYKFPVVWTPSSALAFMDRHAIATQLLSVPWNLPAPVVRKINEEFAGLRADHPGRFGAFAAVPADSPSAMLAEIDYALDTLHLDGVLLTSNAGGQYLGMPFYEPVLAELDRRRTPVLVHPTDNPLIQRLSNARPSSVIEYPFDTTRAITNALYRGVFQRYPNLRLILAHCGGPLPSLAWRLAEHTTMAIGPDDTPIDPEHVAAALRGLYYETALAGSRNSLLPALEVTDSSHILFGTDWPAAPEHAVVHTIENLTAFGVPGVDRENAAALFPQFAA